jgi:hypothetical protein
MQVLGSSPVSSDTNCPLNVTCKINGEYWQNTKEVMGLACHQASEFIALACISEHSRCKPWDAARVGFWRRRRLWERVMLSKIALYHRQQGVESLSHSLESLHTVLWMMLDISKTTLSQSIYLHCK